MPIAWLKSVLGRFRKSTKQAHQSNVRPWLETLEDRLAPVAGMLDPTFGSFGLGIAVTAIGPGGITGSFASSMAIDGNGKIVVAGSSSNGSNYDFALARYNADGRLDTSFGTDGTLTTAFGPSDDVATSVAIDGNGKIVVAGFSFNASNDDFALARYNADGTLDTSFDTDGKLTTPIGSADDFAFSMAIDGNGKIVIAGYSFNGSKYDFALARYNADGSLDTSFDSDGKVTTSFGSSDDKASSVAIDGNGKIVVVGSSSNGSDNDFALARYNEDGTLDTSFDTDGRLTNPIGSADDFAKSVTIDGNGKIVVAGSSSSGTNSAFALARYNADGTFDTSFGTDGKQTTAFKGHAFATGVAIDGNGRLVVSGYSSSSNDSSDVRGALARYNADGALDTSFGTDGMVTSILPGGLLIYAASGIVIDGNGNIVVPGTIYVRTAFGVARYLGDNKAPDFIVTTHFDNASAGANSVAIDGKGKIVVAGGGNGDFALARYNADGTLDPTFDGDGKLTTSFGSSANASSVAIDGNGKIVVAGTTGGGGSTSQFAVARYNADGSLDTSFDNDGKVTTSIGSQDTAYEVVIDGNGKIIVAGYSVKNIYNFALVRYNPDGTLDTSFDGDGKLITSFDPFNLGVSAYAFGVTIDGNGKIVAVGGTFDGSGRRDFAVARYNADGTLDTSFDTDGKVVTHFDSSAIAFSVAIDGYGRIVVAGSSFNANTSVFTLARYNADGTLDTSFDTDGKLTTPIGSPVFTSNSVVIDDNGKIVVAGSSYNGSNNDFALARYNADGSLDTSFDFDGTLTTPVGPADDFASSVAIDGNGMIVVAGSSSNDFALARYLGSHETPSTVAADFDKDGNKDIVWRQQSTGQVWIWRLNGTQLQNSNPYVHIGDSPPGTDWNIVGTGDFDRDGNQDILWRQTSTGQVWIWRLNGTQLQASNTYVPIATSPPGTDWQIRGTGDFDKDGNQDILWRQTSTGQVWIWRLNGTQLQNSNPYVHIGDSPPGTDWQAVGTGDFDKDGNQDILWRQTSTGQVWIWRLNGTQPQAYVQLDLSPAGIDWQIDGSGDFDKDGNQDILWRQASTGAVWIWRMIGTRRQASIFIANSPTGDDWQIS